MNQNCPTCSLSSQTNYRLLVASFFPLPPTFDLLSAVQDLEEGFAELDVEGGVDDGVDGAVEVSQPGDGAVQRRGDTAAPAVGLQHVGQEERQPADDEHTLERRRDIIKHLDRICIATAAFNQNC